jgi:hypothetical protein
MAKSKSRVLITTALVTLISILALPGLLNAASTATAKELKFEPFNESKYQSFVMNWDEKKDPILYAIIRSKAEWDKVFHPAPVMGDNKPFAPEAAVFEKQSLIVVCRVIPAPGSAQVYRVESVTAENGQLIVKYHYEQPKTDASFTLKHSMDLFIAKDEYSSVSFFENGKSIGTLDLKKGQWRVPNADPK